MNNKILVAYGSWTGSTQEVAEAIGQSLREADAEVDVMPAKSIKDLKPYQAAVIGTAIRVGKPHQTVVNLVKKHHVALSKIPVAYFVVCLTMRTDTPSNRASTNTFLKPIRREVTDVKPVSTGLFGGNYDPQKVPFFLNWVMSFAMLPAGDFRNWDAIRQWAESLCPLFDL